MSFLQHRTADPNAYYSCDDFLPASSVADSAEGIGGSQGPSLEIMENGNLLNNEASNTEGTQCDYISHSNLR